VLKSKGWLKAGQIKKKTSLAYKIKIIDGFIKKKEKRGKGSETGQCNGSSLTSYLDVFSA